MSKWRQTFNVHPATDVFPMMSERELDALGADIKANGLRLPIVVGNGLLLEGRNRLEAMERAGIDLEREGLTGSHRWSANLDVYSGDDPVAYIISANIHRRHLTKQQQADLIVAAHKAPGAPKIVSRQVGGKLKEGRPTDEVKAAAVATGKALNISKRTVERSFAKAEGKMPRPEPKRYTARPLPKPRSGKAVLGLEAARRHYLDQCAGPDVDLDAEMDIVVDALREIAGKRVMARALP
jgi:hypothetical protein